MATLARLGSLTPLARTEANRRRGRRALAALAAVCGFGFAGPLVPAAMAADGPNPDCWSGLVPASVVGGDPLEVRGSASQPHQWAITFEGRTTRIDAASIDEQIATPRVSAPQVSSLLMSCSGPDGSRTWRLDVELLPAAGGAVPEASTQSAPSPASLPSGAASQSDFNWLPVEFVIVGGCLLLFWLNFSQKQRRP